MSGITNPQYENNSLANILTTSSRERLLDILKKIKGKKDLVLEPELTPILDLISGFKEFRSVEVEKMYKLEPGPSPGLTQRCVYLLRPSMSLSKLIAEQIARDKREGRTLYKYWVIFVPRKMQECEFVFEREGVYEYLEILEFPLGLVALDTDLFSLELPDFFSSFFLEGDFSWLMAVANSLLQLQGICGSFPTISGQGRCAKMVLDIMNRLKPQVQLPDVEPQIQHLILMDRDVDYASLLLTQVNYSGLLDETFGIKAGKIILGPEITGKPDPTKLPLNSTDELFQEIRDQHFTRAFSLLKWKVEQLKTKHSERKEMNIGDIKKFVTNELSKVQKQHLSLSLMVDASQSMNSKIDEYHALLATETALIEGTDLRECMNYIEDCINQQLPIYSSLRLLCLLSVCQDGITAKDYKTLVTLFLQSYGYEHITTLHSLKKLGLFMEQQTSSGSAAPGMSGGSTSSLVGKMSAAVMRKSTFKATTKKLNLIPMYQEYNFSLPPDPAYVFSGAYIPIVCRLAEQAVSKEGLLKIEETLKLLLPGPTVQFKYNTRTGSNVSVGNAPSSRKASLASAPASRVVLVFFLGGVTHAEISALRYLGNQKGLKFLIGSTAVVNASTVLRLLSPADVS